MKSRVEELRKIKRDAKKEHLAALKRYQEAKEVFDQEVYGSREDKVSYFKGGKGTLIDIISR